MYDNQNIPKMLSKDQVNALFNVIETSYNDYRDLKAGEFSEAVQKKREIIYDKTMSSLSQQGFTGLKED